MSGSQNFYFSNTDVGDILKETTALKNKKMVPLLMSQQNV